jgi:hypothetical protein
MLIICFIQNINSNKKYKLYFNFFNNKINHYIVQLVKFLVLELTHPDLNPKFDMCVVFTVNYSFSGGRRLHQ